MSDFYNLKWQKTLFALHLISLLPRKNTCSIKRSDLWFFMPVRCFVRFTHIYFTQTCSHTCAQGQRGQEVTVISTPTEVYHAFLTAFPTQSIQSHLYELTVIRKQTPGLNSDLSFYHFMWSLQGGAGKAETTKKHVREQHEMKHTLSFSISLSHTHTHAHALQRWFSSSVE